MISPLWRNFVKSDHTAWAAKLTKINFAKKVSIEMAVNTFSLKF